MKVRVNDDECVGDGVCAELCPEIFKMEGDLAVVKKEDVPRNLKIWSAKPLNHVR